MGSGMAAQAVEQAGASFVLALGASRLRSMGLASPASILPIYDAVDFTIDFAVSELLPRTSLPVYIGLPLFDPRLEIDSLIGRLRALGIVGLSNFPAVFHLGHQSKTLQQNGLGLDREIAFLKRAGDCGMETIGYVRNRVDASAMVAAGISTICINFSLNPPKSDSDDAAEKVDEIELAVRDIAGHIRRPNRMLRIYLGGGPVSGGASLDRLCRRAGIDGFIGGSALDRAPLEKSLLNSVQSFREIEVLQNRVERLQRRLERFGTRYGIVCHSASMNDMIDRLETLVKSGSHIVVSGECATGRSQIARLIADRFRPGRRPAPWEVSTTGNANAAEQLFGKEPDNGSRRMVGVLELSDARTPVIVDNILDLSGKHQIMLTEFMSSGQYRPLPGGNIRISNARLILIIEGSIASAMQRGILLPALYDNLKGIEVAVPPLRERIEDIPALAQKMLADKLGPDAVLAGPVIRTLIRHNWPGNQDELKRTIDWLATDGSPTATEAELATFLGQHSEPDGAEPETISQRDRIVQALLLNNLNRSKTARHLGVTRKTLYNQIKKYGILS